MRRLLTWLLVTLGIAAILRRLMRRATKTEISPPRREADPADELRQKLAASRSEEEAAGGGSPTTASTPAASAEESSVEARRAEVHDQGRSTLDEMRADET